MKLKLFMRKLQMYDEHQNPVWYNGPNPNSLAIVQGYLPNNEYQEFTQYVDNLHELVSTWKVRSSETVGGSNKTISNIEKSVTNELQFFGKAFEFVRDWLNDHVAAPLNGIEVKIQVDNCGDIIDFIIKNEGITYCDDDRCNYEVNLKQRDDFYTCVYSTLITDNHMNMFDGNYQHPRFSYCNEFRPTIILSMLFQVMGMVFFVFFLIATIVWFIMEIVEVIYDILDFISFGSLPDLDNPIPNPDEMKDMMLDVFVDLFGCGREHPAPLVRDYIRNVCSKCNIQITQESIPFFFNPSSPYYNLTYLSAEVRKGIDKDNNNDFWIPDNDPLLTLDMLLDKMKKPFNAKWYIKNGVLHFRHVDDLDNDEILFDFIDADKDLILDNVCFTWNEIDKPAYMRVGYTVDAMDNLTNDCLRRYNDIVEFNKPVNPILKGEANRTLIEFAPTRFRSDGIERDYVSRTLDPLNSDTGSAILGILLSSADIGFAVVRNEVKQKMRSFRRAILMQNHTTLLPRLIIWDGQSKKGARAIGTYGYGSTLPSPNLRYNPSGIPYNQANGDDHQYDEFYDEHATLSNYPMFFNAQYKGNLWDFHETDDPRSNPPMNKNFELSIPLCCDTLNRLKVFENSGSINLERRVKVNGGTFYQDGIIKEISLHFSSQNKLGQHIKIKGII